MKNQFIILVFVIAAPLANNILAQDNSPTNKTRVSIISCDVEFIDTLTVKSNYESKPDSIRKVPSLRYYAYFIYDFTLTIIIHEIGDNFSDPLELKLISPESTVQIILLEEALSDLNTQEFYDYEFELREKDYGWYRLELGVFDILDETTEEIFDIVYDERTIYFSN